MEKDYENFVQRMGSFDMNLDDTNGDGVLIHHGVKGQKWGVRRFQNEDGTRTSAGKRRERSPESDYSERNNRIKKAALATAGVAATAGAAYYLHKTGKDKKMWSAIKKASPGARAKTKELLAKGGKKTLQVGSKAAKETGKTLGKAGKKAGEMVGKSFEKTGQAMIDAAMLSVGGVALNRVAEKYKDDTTADQQTREKNQIIRDTMSAGIKAATDKNYKGPGNQNNNSNKNNNTGNQTGADAVAEYKSVSGEPSKKGVNKSSQEWSSLFKDKNGNNRDDETKAKIRAMAQMGYDIDQIRKYLEVKHGGMRSRTMRFVYSDELYHHGVKGQKWGVRRFQNADGSLTAAGTKRYGYDSNGNQSAKGKYRQAKDNAKKSRNAVISREYSAMSKDAARTTASVRKLGKNQNAKALALETALEKRDDKRWDKVYAAKSKYKSDKAAAKKEYKNSAEYQKKAALRKKLLIGAGVAAAAGAAYAGKKVIDKKHMDLELLKEHNTFDTIRNRALKNKSNRNVYDGRRAAWALENNTRVFFTPEAKARAEKMGAKEFGKKVQREAAYTDALYKATAYTDAKMRSASTKTSDKIGDLIDYRLTNHAGERAANKAIADSYRRQARAAIKFTENVDGAGNFTSQGAQKLKRAKTTHMNYVTGRTKKR